MTVTCMADRAPEQDQHMAITMNTRGTSVPYFTIGKSGTTIYQGDVDPSLFYVCKDGDIWIDTSALSIHIRTQTATWAAPRLGDLSVDGTALISASSLSVVTSPTGALLVNTSGTGPAKITTTNQGGLDISTAGTGLPLFVNGLQWPSATPTSGQVLGVGESNQLTWTSPILTTENLANNVTTAYGYVPMPRHTVTTVATNYSVQLSDSIVLANGAITVTLPAAASVYSGKSFTVKRISASGTVNLEVSGGGTIDGNTQIAISTVYTSITVVSDGTAYWAI